MSTGRAKVLGGHPLAVVSTCADLDAELFRLAATSTTYQPAGYSTDDPALWRLLPAHVPAPHRCRCGARFHVRRHLENHARMCPDQGTEARVMHKPNSIALVNSDHP